MIKTYPLREAIAKAFDIDLDTIPEFTSSKPVKQAREWLASKGYNVDYRRGEAPVGSFAVVTFGASGPMNTVVEEGDSFKGARVLASLSPGKSKSQQRREAIMSDAEGENVEEAAIVTEAPEEQSQPQTTVVEPEKPKRKRKKG